MDTINNIKQKLGNTDKTDIDNVELLFDQNKLDT